MPSSTRRRRAWRRPSRDRCGIRLSRRERVKRSSAPARAVRTSPSCVRAGSALGVISAQAVHCALHGVARVLDLVLEVGLALGLGLLVAGQLAEALLGLAAQLVLRVLELLVGAHRKPP